MLDSKQESTGPVLVGRNGRKGGIGLGNNLGAKVNLGHAHERQETGVLDDAADGGRAGDDVVERLYCRRHSRRACE